MRSKVTYFLLALNLLLFGYLILSERPWSRTQTIEDNRRRVLGPEAANLATIAIAPGVATRPSDNPAPTETIRLNRAARGDGWVLSAPIEWPANKHAVDPILTALQFLENETSFLVSDLEKSRQTLANYGLAEPSLIVTATPVTPEDAATPAPPFTLRIGDATAVGSPSGRNLYVLSPDGLRVHVVGPNLLSSLTVGLDQLRSDRLFTIPVFEARALTLQITETQSVRTRLRRETSRWILEAPITTRAAKAPVELLINDLGALRVARFVAPSDAPPADRIGLAAPRIRVTLEGNSRRETLLLGRPVRDPSPSANPADPVEFYARLDERPTLFTVSVPAAVLTTLEAAQTLLREPRILDFDPALISSLTIAPAEGVLPGPLRIQRLDSAPGSSPSWQILSPRMAAPLRGDPALIARFIQTLQLLQAESPRPDASPFISDAPSRLELENLGFNRPERTITLQLDAPPTNPAAPPVTGPSTLVLELASPGGGDSSLYARVLNQPYLYAVPRGMIHHFDPAPRSWRDRGLARLPETSQITRLVLRSTVPDAAPVLDYTVKADAPPPPHVGPLLAALRDLRAQTIVREDFPATVPVDGVERPWAYTLEAFTEPPSDTALVLSLAERTGAMTQLAGSSTLGLVFTLEQPILDALWALLYTPPAPPSALTILP